MSADGLPKIDRNDPKTFPHPLNDPRFDELWKEANKPLLGPHVADLWEQAIGTMIDGDETDFVEMLRSGVPMTVEARHMLAEMIDRKSWGVGWYKLKVYKMSDSKIAKACKEGSAWLETVAAVAGGASVNAAIALSDEKNNNGDGTAKRAWQKLKHLYYNGIREEVEKARRDSLRRKKRTDSCP